MKFLNKIFSRVFTIGFIIFIQVVFLLFLMFEFQLAFRIVRVFFILITISQIVSIINSNKNTAYKMAWIIPMVALPTFGGMVYFVAGGKRPGRFLRKRMDKSESHSQKFKPDCSVTLYEIEKQDLCMKNIFGYIDRMGYPVYKKSDVCYYPLGEYNFPVMLEELRNAKHYIFLEYFIIADGYMWNSILDVLKDKASRGLDVRLIYDDVGCISLLPNNYPKTLESYGIKCIKFNPFRPVLSSVANNRDHRKIMVIDGHTGFTGGINLADEYINRIERFGHWKDDGIMLKGDAVWNLTEMFLSTWNALRRTEWDFSPYFPDRYIDEISVMPQGDGYICPYGDTPLDDEPTSENVYLSIINKAQRYIYITTPYLIISAEMTRALTLAAKRGVDVRIITPGIPDKKTVFQATRSYYPALIRNGVKIYEYSKGFVHCKNVVVDDEIATVGTVNFDFRSLYLHFENGCLFYKSSIISQVKEDFLDTQQYGNQIVLEENLNVGFFRRIYYAVLRLFSPLM